MVSKKKAMSSTERSRKCRAKQKLDPQLVQTKREKDKLRKREERSFSNTVQRTQRETKEIREKKHLEIARYRAKKKAEKEAAELEHRLESQRETGGHKAKKVVAKRASAAAYRERKRTCEDSDKLRRQNAVLRTQRWRLRVKFQTKNSKKEPEVTPAPLGEFSSYWSERRMVRKVKEVLPKTPNKKAKVIEALSTDSPNTSQILAKRGILSTPKMINSMTVLQNLEERLSQCKPKGGCEKEKLHAYKHLKAVVTPSNPMCIKNDTWRCVKKYFRIRKSYGIPLQRLDWWHAAKRKRRKDRLNDTVCQSVKDFLLSPQISREIPAKSEAVKIKDDVGNVSFVPKHVMTTTLEEAFRLYCTAHPEHKIGLTSFKKIAPHNLKKVSETSRRTCLCTRCCNLALKLEALKKFLQKVSKSTEDAFVDLAKCTKQTLTDGSLCPYQDHPKKLCLDRECDLCKSKLDDMLSPLFPELKDDIIVWYHWEYVQIMKDDKPKKLMSCVVKSTAIEDYKKFLKEDMVEYPSHIFRANWQHDQMANSISSLNEKEAIILMDYNENYRCMFKDEVQSGYFDQRQVTIHPSMCYYLEGGNKVKHAIICVSAETRYDAHLTKAFEDATINLLKQQPSLADLKLVIEWTDGCAAQYKCRTSVADISLRAQENIKMERNYFETSHGKSPCDGIGSVVKNSCLRAVTAGKAVIGDAQSLLKFCTSKLSHDAQEKQKAGKTVISKWDFLYVESGERASDDIGAVKGIRKLHAIKSTGPYQVATKLLSCYCPPCRKGGSSCDNSAWVDYWKQLEVQSSKASAPVTKTKPFPKYKPQAKKVPQSKRALEKDNTPDIEPGHMQPAMFQEGDFVAVKLSIPGKNRPIHIYMAEVIEADNTDTDILVSFMARTPGGLYQWPHPKDVGLQMTSDIVCTVDPPNLQNKRKQFRFSEDMFAKIKKQTQNIKGTLQFK